MNQDRTYQFASDESDDTVKPKQSGLSVDKAVWLFIQNLNTKTYE